MFTHICALSWVSATECVAACSAEMAHKTLKDAHVHLLRSNLCDWKIEPEGAESCRIRANERTWVVYHCALSLYGPENLHPFAPRLARTFLNGDAVTRFIVLLTVLQWAVPNPQPPYPQSSRAWLLARLPEVLEAFPMSAPIPRACLVGILSLPALLPSMPTGTWAERNKAVMAAASPVELRPAPTRFFHFTGAESSYQKPDPFYNNNQATMLLLAFQALEQCTSESPYSFTATEPTEYYLVNAVTSAWFLST